MESRRSSQESQGRIALTEGPILITTDGTFIQTPRDAIVQAPLSPGMNSPLNMNSTTSDVFNSTNNPFIKRDLYGGAITTSLPLSFEDISTIREVPDHQEVFVDRNSDVSLIIETLAYEDTVSNTRAIRHFFEDLADFNQARETVIEFEEIIKDPDVMPKISHTFTKCTLVGRQIVKKFSKDRSNSTSTSTASINADGDVVRIFMTLVRLPEVGTDLLLHLNVPLRQLSQSNVSSEGMTYPPEDIMKAVLGTFEIVNWSLFA